MSDTPITDSAEMNVDYRMVLPFTVVASELCRVLERENTALKADKERMDWCDKNLSGLTLVGKSMREYVDAARKEQS